MQCQTNKEILTLKFRKMEQEININEMLNEAAQISDHRNKVFNELKTQIIQTLLPALAKVMETYDKYVLFSSNFGWEAVKNFSNQSNCCLATEREFVVAYVVENGSITIRSAWEEFDSWHDCFKLVHNKYSESVENIITKTNAVIFAQDIINKIKKLNAKYDKDAQEMQSMSEMIAKNFQ